jgi:hypothetical protein
LHLGELRVLETKQILTKKAVLIQKDFVFIKQETLTSSTKTLPGRGGKASNPDALLRIRICRPFLALCPERKRNPKGNQEKDANR